MTLGADITAALPELRAAAESMMHSTVIIRRPSGSTWNEETGTSVPAWVDVYEGPARIRFKDTQPRVADAAGEQVVDQAPVLSLPIATSADVRVDDIATVTANPTDPGLIGLQFRIAGVHAQTHATARRFPVEVVSRD